MGVEKSPSLALYRLPKIIHSILTELLLADAFCKYYKMKFIPFS